MNGNPMNLPPVSIAAAKAALVAMVTNLQMELEGTGVRASVVHPGPTMTSMGWSLPAAVGVALTVDVVVRPHELVRVERLIRVVGVADPGRNGAR